MTATTNTNTPAYVAVCRQIEEFCAEHGLELLPQPRVIDGCPGNKNWACFQLSGTGHKVYVPRDERAVGRLHTTVTPPPGASGRAPHVSASGKDLRPGKIEAFWHSDPASVASLLRLWAGETARLREARLPGARTASEPASEPASQPVRVGTLEDLTA